MQTIVEHDPEPNPFVLCADGIERRKRPMQVGAHLRHYLVLPPPPTAAQLTALRRPLPVAYGAHPDARPNPDHHTPLLTNAERAFVNERAESRFPYDWRRTARLAAHLGKACYNDVLAIFAKGGLR